ncbi:MAG: hypothetical protein IJX96_00945 [Clostridia bacterium]|nr:hypothetical protein [Clostridia bacterium]
MKNYIKAVLYAYPLLKNVSEDYREHIRNKALLSYRSDKPTIEIAEYIAEEIVEKERLEWLKGRVEEVLAKLDDVERTLLAIRYFGKEKRIKKAVRGGSSFGAWSERKYFRRQKRLGDKVGGMFVACGVSESVFEREFATMGIFKKIYAFVCEGKDQRITQSERRWIGV